MADHVMTATGSILFRIDNDADETDRGFILEHDGGGGGTELFAVNEAGRVIVHGPFRRSGAHRVENTTANAAVAVFETQANVVAAVTGLGVGVFTGGIRLTRNTDAANPDAAGLAGETGQLVLWYNSGTGKDEIWACNNGAGPNWNRATL